MSNYFTPQVEAKKPIEGAGIRAGIEKQQKKISFINSLIPIISVVSTGLQLNAISGHGRIGIQ